MEIKKLGQTMGKQWLQNKWIVLLTLLGALLRLYQLGAQSLWLDELFSYFVARGSLQQVIEQTILGDTNPPLFNLLLWAGLKFGETEFFVRFISALFSIATIPLFYRFIEELWDQLEVRLVAVLLLVINPFHIYYAQEARMYAMLAFFQLASFYTFYRAWHRNGKRDWLLFGLMQLIVMYTHSLGGLNLFVFAIYLLINWAGFKERWRGLFGAAGVVVILFLPWVGGLMYQSTQVLQGFWEPEQPGLRFLRLPFMFVFNQSLPIQYVPSGLVIVILLFLFGLYWSGRSLLIEEINRSERELLRWGILMLAIIPVVALLVSLIKPIFVERIMISASFGLFLLWGWVWTQRPHWLERLGMIALLLFIGIAFNHYYQHPELQKPAMREAALALEEAVGENEPVIHLSDWSALAFRYYVPEIEPRFLAGDPVYLSESTRAHSGVVNGLVPEEQDMILKEHDSFWLIVFVDHSESYMIEQTGQFLNQYQLMEHIEMGPISLLHFRIGEE